MGVDSRKTCAVCAWRGTCAKKFSKSGELSVHCIDFSFDVTIGAKKEEDEDEEIETKKGNEKNI